MSQSARSPYPGEPIFVSQSIWLYLEKIGLTVVQEDRDDEGKHRATVQANIPWSTLCDAVDLHRKLTKKT